MDCSASGVGTTSQYMEEKKVGFLLYFFCQENSRWTKDLNVKMEPLMYLEENKAEYFYTFGMEKHFLIMSTGLFLYFYLISSFFMSVNGIYNQKKSSERKLIFILCFGL